MACAFAGGKRNELFSFYGWQLFLLVSGFGLAVSMMNQPKSWGAFVLDRLKKLYPLLLTGVVFYCFGKIVMEGKIIGFWERKEIIWLDFSVSGIHPSL